MELIIINRKIFKSLDENLKEDYIFGILDNIKYTDILNIEDINYIVEGIKQVINTNEDFYKKYGVMQPNGLLQVDETCSVPADEIPTGSYYTTGNLIIYPFDWSWDDNGDFDYSFFIARIL